jgi:hypothetical protein
MQCRGRRQYPSSPSHSTALAQRCGITYSRRYCDSNLVRLELLRAVTSIRAARSHDQADGDAGDHALRLGASGRGTLSLYDDLSAALFNVRRPGLFSSLRQLFVFPSYFLQAISRLRARFLLRLSERLLSSVAPVLRVCEVLVVLVVNHFIIPFG